MVRVQGTQGIEERVFCFLDQWILEKTLTLSIVGAGGKTSTLYFLANHYKDKTTVVVTTTTAMFEPKDIPVYFQREEVPDQVGIYSLFQRVENNKVFGFAVQEIDEFIKTRDKNLILCEADGAKRKSLKAYADYEPPIPTRSDFVVVVLGVDVLGKPLEEELVHRSKEFTKITGRKQGEIITLEDYYSLLLHEQGFLKNIPEEAFLTVFFNKVDTLKEELDVEAMAKRLLDHPKVNCVIFGSMQQKSFTDAFMKGSPE